MSSLKFVPAVRREILEKLRSALCEGNAETLLVRRYALEARYPGMFEEARKHKAATEFVSHLESLASNLSYWIEQRGSREPEQRRKERLAAVANALDALVAALAKADDLALGHAMPVGLANIKPSIDAHRPIIGKAKALLRAVLRYGSFGRLVKIIGLKRGLPKPFTKANVGTQGLNLLRARWLAHDVQNLYLVHVTQFAEGLRSSIRTLPPLDTDLYSPAYTVAETIESLLSQLWIEISTSDTGLAGTAFAATMELAGFKTPRAGYWLKKAKDAATARNDK